MKRRLATRGGILLPALLALVIAGCGGDAEVSIVRPDGSTLGVAFIVNALAGGYDLPALPLTGNYTVFVDPPSAATFVTTVTLGAR